jgi:hypothetical protein
MDSVTDSAGKAAFAISADGTYRLYSGSNGDYLPASSGPFQLTLCPPQQNVSQNGSSNQTQGNQPPLSGQPSQGGAGPAANQTAGNVTVPLQNGSPPSQSQALAGNAITAAEAAIGAAKAAGKDTAAAQAQLVIAQNAYAAGEYAQAIVSATQAETLAAAAGPAATAPAAPSAQKNPVSGGQIPWAALIVVLALLAGVAYWFSLGRKKG